MIKLDHLAIDVGDVETVRDWYGSVLGLVVEFEISDPPVVGLRDDADFTLILVEQGGDVTHCTLYFQVEDVAAVHRELADRGVEVLHGPQVNTWGYGLELLDPDSRLVGLWDEQSMTAQGQQPSP